MLLSKKPKKMPEEEKQEAAADFEDIEDFVLKCGGLGGGVSSGDS